MLTPAEELGLAGQRLGARVRSALARIPGTTLANIIRQVVEDAQVEGMTYLHDGEPTTVRVLAAPLTVLPHQVQYLHAASYALHNATKRLVSLYFLDPDVRAALPLPHAEESWIRECWTPSHHLENPVFGRLDAVVELESAHWKDTLHYLEPNMSGVGGLHMFPTAEHIVAHRLVPAIHARDASLLLERGVDIRDLLMGGMLEHLRALGRPGRRICFVEPKYAGNGPEEQDALADYFHQRFGVAVCHADPAELAREGDEVLYQGDAVDLAYRDYSVQDLLALAETGVDVSPMRLLLAQNRTVSSIAAELDMKSAWEVFTDARLTERHFTLEERQLFRRHVPWTRLVRGRTTALPDGSEGDLLDFARRERETLVLKPNRNFGGYGVCIGPAVTQSAWDAALERAAGERDQWVVQRAVHLPVHDFPVLGRDGNVHAESFYVVVGLAPSEDGVSVTARASQKQVVNVAQRGGICAVLVGHPPAGVIQ